MPWVFILFWCYFIAYGLFILEWPSLCFGGFTPAYQAQAGQALIEGILIPLGAIFWFDQIKKIIPVFTIIACLSVWFDRSGFLNAPSFNSAFAVLAMYYCPVAVQWLIIATIFTHHGTTAILMVLGMTAPALFWSKHSQRSASRYVFTGLFIASVLSLILLHHGPWMDGMDRIEHWKRYFAFWAKEPAWIAIGVGPGSFIWTAMLLDHFKGALFLQMHSDWLQILFELGVVGLIGALTCYFIALKKAMGNHALFGQLVALGIFGLTYHPLRYFPTAFLSAMVVVQALSYKSGLRQAPPSNSFE
jgi:hypothetical protein